MIKITSDFDSRKFQRDLEKQMQSAAQKQILSKLRRLTAKGLRVRFGNGSRGSVDVRLSGSDQLIAEAERILR